LAAGVADRAGMGEAVGGLVQQGAEDVDRAALKAFPADQYLGPVVAWSVSCQRPAWLVGFWPGRTARLPACR
jgi:hypothetical protein